MQTLTKTLSIAILACLIPSYAGAALVADWEFNGTANDFTDSSGNGHHGTGVHNALTDGSTLVLDGDRTFPNPGLASSVRVPSLDTTGGVPMITTGGITMFARVLVDLPGSDPPATVAAWADNGSARPNVMFTILSTGEPQLRTFRGIDLPPLTGSFVTGTTALGAGFHNLALTVDGASGDTSIYVDGVLSDDGSGKTGTIDISHIRADKNYEFNIGRVSQNDNPFSGQIDRLLLFDEEFSDSEITALFGIPEPSTLTLATLGFLFLLKRRKRRLLR